MAIIALNMGSPCVGTNCSKIKFTDTSGLYDSALKPKGWSGTANPGGVTFANVVSSRISLTLDGETSPFFTVYPKLGTTDLYPAEPSAEFSFAEYDWTGADGIYLMTYESTVTVGNSVEPLSQKKVLITCKAESCIKKLYQKYLASPSETNKDAWINASDMLAGVKYSFMCNSLTESKSILATLDKICKLANSDCGCGCS